MLKRKPTLKQYLDDYQSSKYSSRAVKDSTINSSQIQQKKIQQKVLAFKNVLSSKVDTQTFLALQKDLDQIVNIFKLNFNQGLKLSSFNRPESPGISCKISGLSQKKLSKTKKTTPPVKVNPDKENFQQKKQSILIFDCKQEYLKPTYSERFCSTFNSLQQKNVNVCQTSNDKLIRMQKQKSVRKAVSFEPPQLSRKDSCDYDYLQIESIRNTHISSIFSNTHS